MEIYSKKRGRPLQKFIRYQKSFSKFGNIFIGHIRWSTYGGVSEKNVHRHISSFGSFAIVHNGVIENYETIKIFLIKEWFAFNSETELKF